MATRKSISLSAIAVYLCERLTSEKIHNITQARKSIFFSYLFLNVIPLMLFFRIHYFFASIYLFPHYFSEMLHIILQFFVLFLRFFEFLRVLIQIIKITKVYSMLNKTLHHLQWAPLDFLRGFLFCSWVLHFHLSMLYSHQQCWRCFHL